MPIACGLIDHNNVYILAIVIGIQDSAMAVFAQLSRYSDGVDQAEKTNIR